jgi:hypothetical protein
VAQALEASLVAFSQDFSLVLSAVPDAAVVEKAA